MNYYEILRIPKSASMAEIRKAYKNLVKRYHPDIYVGNKAFAENKIKEINEAYEVLTHEIKKEEYDAMLRNQAYNQRMNYSSNQKKQETYENKKVVNVKHRKTLYEYFQKYINNLEKSYKADEKEDFIILGLTVIILFFGICIFGKVFI